MPSIIDLHFFLCFYLLTLSRTEAASFSQSTGGTTEHSAFDSRKGKDVYFLQSIQTSSGAQPDSYSLVTVDSCRG